MDHYVGLPPVTHHHEPRLFGAAPDPWSLRKYGIRKHAGQRGQGVVVGVVDTGRPVHADLESAVLSGEDFTGENDPTDRNGHGTHVCGIIAGKETNGFGTGVAPWCKIRCYKALNRFGAGSDQTIAAGILAAVRDGVDIINVSAGSQGPMPLTDAAIRKATDAGIWVVVAAGNAGDNSQSNPAMNPNVVSVAATDENENAAPFSEPSSVDVAAPGVRIESTYLGGTYEVLSGTSMASPYVAGLLAIFLSDLLGRGEKKPAPHALFDLLDKWSQDIGTPGKDAKTGPGVISPAKYEASLVKPEPPTPVEAWTPTIRFTENWALCKRA